MSPTPPTDSEPRFCPGCGTRIPGGTGAICVVCSMARAVTPDPSQIGDLLGEGDWMDALETPPEKLEADGVRRFGRYELVEEIGRGGMGVVYRARQSTPARLVALKVMLPQTSRTKGLIERFRAETEAIASLDHPHILPVYDAGERDGRPFYTMKLAEGGALSGCIANYAGRPREAVRLVVAIARGVDHAHRRGILHRDLKPANILLDGSGGVYVADFGIAKLIHRQDSLTVTGAALGTPAYMAPEQAVADSALTVAADIYGIGAILYELLAQRPPFVGRPLQILHDLATEVPPAPRTIVPGISADLETICLKCLEKEPAQRYATAEDLAADLERWLEGRSVLARPTTPGERAWRWARRNPLPAGLAAISLGLLIAVATNSTLAARRLESARAETTLQLRASLLAQAKAARLGTAAGSRRNALEALQEAARIRPGLDLRNEAIATLPLLEGELQRLWSPKIDFPQVYAFAPDLESVLIEEEPGVLVRRRVGDAQEVARYAPGTGTKRVFGLPVFSVDGIVAIRTDDNVIRLWDRAGKTVVFALSDRPSPLGSAVEKHAHDLAFSPDGKRFFAGLSGGGFSVHAVPGGEEIGRWPAPVPPVILRPSPDGKKLAVVLRSSDQLQFLDFATLAAVRVVALPSIPICLAWSPGNEQVACGTRNSRIYRYTVETGQLIDSLPVHESGGVSDVCYHPTAPLLAGNGSDEILWFWDLRSGRPVLHFEEAVNNPVLTFDARGERIGVYRSTTRDAGLVRLRFPPLFTSAAPPRPVRSAISSGAIDLSPDGRWLVTSQYGAVQFRSAANAAVVARLPGANSNDMMTAQFSRDGRQLLVCSERQGISRHPLVSDGQGGETLGPMEVLDPEPEFQLCRVAADGRLLLISEQLGQCKLLTPGSVEAPVRWPVPNVVDAAFLPDEASVVTTAETPGGAQPHVRIWEARSGEGRGGFGKDFGGRVDVARGGPWALVLGEVSTKLYRLGTWAEGAAIPKTLQAHTQHARLAPDGQWLVIEKSGRLHLLRAETAEIFAVLEAPALAGTCVNQCISPDGARLYTLWQYGSVHVWDLAAVRRELRRMNLDW